MISHHTFGAVWLWNIKYLSNPWNTSFSLFSLVWVSKTHMLTSLLLTKHFQGRLKGVVYECKNTSIFVCQRCLGTMGISNGTKHEPAAKKKNTKQERRSYRRRWLVCGHEKWSHLGLPRLVPFLILIFIWPSEAAASSHADRYSSTVTNYLC